MKETTQSSRPGSLSGQRCRRSLAIAAAIPRRRSSTPERKMPNRQAVSRLAEQVSDFSKETMGAYGFEGFEHGLTSPEQMGRGNRLSRTPVRRRQFGGVRGPDTPFLALGLEIASAGSVHCWQLPSLKPLHAARPTRSTLRTTNCCSGAQSPSTVHDRKAS